MSGDYYYYAQAKKKRLLLLCTVFNYWLVSPLIVEGTSLVLLGLGCSIWHLICLSSVKKKLCPSNIIFSMSHKYADPTCLRDIENIASHVHNYCKFSFGYLSFIKSS